VPIFISFNKRRNKLSKLENSIIHYSHLIVVTNKIQSSKTPIPKGDKVRNIVNDRYDMKNFVGLYILLIILFNLLTMFTRYHRQYSLCDMKKK
jgi:hypothetical protein